MKDWASVETRRGVFASLAISGIDWIAEEPVPITPTSLPEKSTWSEASCRCDMLCLREHVIQGMWESWMINIRCHGKSGFNFCLSVSISHFLLTSS